jgi:hypothetical protein
MAEHHVAGMREVFVEAHAKRTAAQQAASVALRTSSGSRRRSLAVELEQVKRVDEHAAIGTSITQLLEHSQPALVTRHRLAIDRTRPHFEPVDRLDDQRSGLQS